MGGKEKFQAQIRAMMVKIPYADLEWAFSSERFARYLAWIDGDCDRAVELYSLNAQISEALYVPLQTLELALRNRIHGVISEAFHNRWFLDEGFLQGDRQAEQLAKAINDIKNSGRETTFGRIVAELTVFGLPCSAPATRSFGKQHFTGLAKSRTVRAFEGKISQAR